MKERPIEELSRDELLDRLNLKPARHVEMDNSTCFDFYRQFEIRTGRKLSREEEVAKVTSVTPLPPPVEETAPVQSKPCETAPPVEVNTYELPQAPFQLYPPGTLAKDFDKAKMKGFIEGHLMFHKYAKVEDVPQPNREAYTEYKVKLRLRELQRAELTGHFRRVAGERGAIDYALTSTAHPIYPDILKFDKEWRIVQTKNRQKLQPKYMIARTFGVGPEDYTNLPDEHKTAAHIGCALALLVKSPLKPLHTSSYHARVTPNNKEMTRIKPHTPSGKLPGTDIITRRPLVFNDDNIKNFCIQYDCKIAMTFSTLKQLFQNCASEQRFTIPFEIQPVDDWLSDRRVNLLFIGKKLPDRIELDRNITGRYYKRQLRTLAMSNSTTGENGLKLKDQAGSIYPDKESDTAFGRLTQEETNVQEMPQGQPTCYSIVQIGSERVLVRYPADGMRKVGDEELITKILPKLEYQMWYGGEMMTPTEIITEWLWSKCLNVSVSRPRVQVQTGQVFLEEVFPVDNWRNIEADWTKKNNGMNILETLTKKVSYVLQKLSGQLERHEGEKLSHLMEYDVQSKVMKVLKENTEGDRTLLRDLEGEYESIMNLHLNLQHPYWQSLAYWIDIDSELFMPYHLSNGVIPYAYPPKPNQPNAQGGGRGRGRGRGGRGGGRGHGRGRGHGGRGHNRR